MVNSVNDSKSTACTNCGKDITSLSKNMSPITATTEEEYQKQKKTGFGMYCPNCDHYLCLACLPTIGAKSGKKLFGGLFSRTKTENEMRVEDLPVDSATRNKLDEKLKVKGTRIVVLRCVTCGAYFGQFPEDKTKFVENFANKITEDYEDITIDEITTFIDDLQLFISRLEKQNLISQRTEQLRVVLEMGIKQTGLPKLKQLITQSIENKEYDEARQLCATGTQWNGYLKNKGRWEKDLQSIETLMNLSKSGIGQKKIIEGGPRKIFTVPAVQNKEGENSITNSQAEDYRSKAIESLNSGDFRAAIDMYDRAIEIRERLVNTEGRTELANDLAEVYMNKANVFMRLGDHRDSVEFCDKAIEIRERLVFKEKMTELENKLAEAYMNKAIAGFGIGNPSAAFEVLDKAIEILERLVISEGRSDLSGDLAIVGSMKTNMLLHLGEESEAKISARKFVPILRLEIERTGRADLKNILNGIETKLGNFFD